MKKIIVEYRITNKDHSIDKDGQAEFKSVTKAKAWCNRELKKWDGTGAGIANCQIVELEITPDGDMPFPAYYEEERLATYTPETVGWYKDEG